MAMLFAFHLQSFSLLRISMCTASIILRPREPSLIPGGKVGFYKDVPQQL